MQDYSVFIGRFQPFHKGHQATLEAALERSKHVIVICGSAEKPRDIRNPWTAEERISMIQMTLSAEELQRVTVVPVRDFLYNDNAWVAEITKIVESIVWAYDEGDRTKADCRQAVINGEIKVSLIGHNKDHTSYYLNIFAHWGLLEEETLLMLNASDIRKSYFQKEKIIEKWLPKASIIFLEDFKEDSSYLYLRREFDFVDIHKDSWNCVAVQKYKGPLLNTVDAVITCMGNILLIKRRAHPGKDLWAFPGGYILEHERIEDAMIRELREETKIKLPSPVLRGSIATSRVFDDPTRSVRGRIITHAYHIDLPPQKDGKLPKIKGGDDASKAKWVPLEDFDLMISELFEDHYYIGNYFLRR